MTSYEVVLDNSKLLANCYDEAPPSLCIDLSTGIFNYNTFGDTPFGAYEDGKIVTLAPSGGISVMFPAVPLTFFNRANTYRWTVTFEGPEEDYEILAFPFNTISSWQTSFKTYIAYHYGGYHGDGQADMGVLSAETPDWNYVPEGYQGMSFEFDEPGTTITSICWEVIG